jgi:redox-sensitive bicupin YhaK (pirin superfamily)
MFSPVELLIEPRRRDIGGVEVNRILPVARRRTVGPFIFLDRIGPLNFAPGTGMEIGPHPHIGLSTLTYLFAGEAVHRDSIGSVQLVRPGEVNWMTAGRGIVHSERTPPELHARGSLLSGVQIWVALPQAEEETAPSFSHHAEADLPLIRRDGTRFKLIAGSLLGEHSPVPVFSPTFLADIALEAQARFVVPEENAERALLGIEGAITLAGERYAAGSMLVLQRGEKITVEAPEAARLLLLGGAPLDGPRHIWWNFVSSSRERIEAAKIAWKEDRLGHIPGESERVPLPE